MNFYIIILLNNKKVSRHDYHLKYFFEKSHFFNPNYHIKYFFWKITIFLYQNYNLKYFLKNHTFFIIITLCIKPEQVAKSAVVEINKKRSIVLKSEKISNNLQLSFNLLAHDIYSYEIFIGERLDMIFRKIIFYVSTSIYLKFMFSIYSNKG